MVDFGKNVIPYYLKSGESVFAYNFKGYWKDVGTIDSLWHANMEFLDENNGLNLQDRTWRIYSRNPIAPPQIIAETAEIKDAMIVDGSYIAGKVDHSILSANVRIQPGSVVTDSVIMPGAKIGKNVTIHRAIIGEGAVIGDDVVIDGTDKIAVIGNKEVVGVTSHEE